MPLEACSGRRQRPASSWREEGLSHRAKLTPGYSAVDEETYEIDASRPVCPAFKEIGSRLGPIDLAFLPIGAYSTRPFLSTVHCAPIDAVRVFKDVVSSEAWAVLDTRNQCSSCLPQMTKLTAERAQGRRDPLGHVGPVERADLGAAAHARRGARQGRAHAGAV